MTLSFSSSQLWLTVRQSEELLHIFGEANGLHANILKSTATPIRCSEHERQNIAQHLLCPIKDFPIPYLGVPLSLWKLRIQDLQQLIDNLHDKLSGWHAGLLSKGDHLVLIKSVLAATPIHIMLATEIPKPIREAIIKCQRTFFGASGRDDGGGSCAVAWNEVCRPAELGGLGVLDIERMSWALRAKWSWLSSVDATKPWRNFPIKTNKHIDALIHAATKVQLGDGARIFFWSDRRIAGQSIVDLATAVIAGVGKRAFRTRKVASVLPGNAWIRHISVALSAEAIGQFLNLVETLTD
jgi:hypothetical protein